MDLKEQLIQALTDSLVETCTSVFSVVPMVEKKDDITPRTAGGGNIVASLGFAGNLEGSLVVVLSDKAACKVVAKMICCDITEVNQDVLDGSGELANILTGGMKMRIAGMNYNVELCIPTVIRSGDPLSIAKLGKTDVVNLSVTSAEFDFDVILSYAVAHPAATAAKSAQSEAKKEDSSNTLLDMINKAGGQAPEK